MDLNGYQGFGSFFSGNVEEMVTAKNWIAPFKPELVAKATELSSQHTGFGKAACDKFLIDFASWVFVNHGAFGGCLRNSYIEARAWQDHCERQPLRFLDRCV